MTRSAKDQSTGPKQGPEGMKRRDGQVEDLAGPHATSELTNPEATPGTGALPTGTTGGDEVDPGAG